MTPKLDRRQALATFGTVSLGALLAACGDDEPGSPTSTGVATEDGGTTTVEPRSKPSAATAKLFEDAPSCSLTPEETEGPYYFDADSIRGDIREDREGTKLRLAVRVRDAAGSEAIANAVVDFWHCDALGVYSGFEAASTGGAPGGGGGPTDDKTYLRGAQVTNSDGIVEFVTVYPGWYRGRTVHIHAKVHLDKKTVLTSQLYFDEKVTASVYKRRPYSQHSGRDTLNENDGIFDEQLLLKLTRDGDGWRGVMSFDVENT
jgi:protocatechuate 3,4-dioxygenase beta subunit